MSDKPYKLILGDCLEKMKEIPDKSIDACITDLPYGTTACSWDVVIPFAPMWIQLKRICKPSAAICLFGSQPFTTTLIASNLEAFKYVWTWDKQSTGNFALAKYQPLRATEDITVFGFGTIRYFPQMRKGVMRGKGGGGKCTTNGIRRTYSINDMYYPTNIIRISNANFSERGLHDTQKPVELLRYLIKTYSQEGETVLDFTMGSGSTGVAAMIENRRFIGIEKDEHYFSVSEARIRRALGQGVDIPQRITTEKPLPLFASV